jgi:hypothetical protein
VALFRRAAPPPPPADDELVTPIEPVDSGPQLPPSRLQGSEPLYGVVVGLELLVVAVLTIFARHGAGAPRHYSTADDGLVAVAVASAIAYLGLLRMRNRTVAAFGAIIAAYLLSVPKGPTWVRDVHEYALFPPLVYAIVVAQRLRKATKQSVATDQKTGKSRTPAPTRDRPAARRGRAAPPARETGPPRSGRYTPPKAKRAATKRGR